MAHGWTVVCQAAFVDYVSIVTRRHVHRRALRDRGTLVYAATSPEPVNSTPPHAIRTNRPNQSQTDVRLAAAERPGAIPGAADLARFRPPGLAGTSVIASNTSAPTNCISTRSPEIGKKAANAPPK